MITLLDTIQPDFEYRLKRLLERESESDLAVEKVVSTIISHIRQRGDDALLEYTNQFDRLSLSNAGDLILGAERISDATAKVLPELRGALEIAAQRIRHYHEREVNQGWLYRDADGTQLGQKITPLDRVGVYVPGGKAAYPSSVLMTVIPARVAGVGEVAMVVPTPDGEINPAVIAAADIAGVDQIFTIGGAQAVAALAWGTKTVPAVDKIVGPGNIYVATAKKQVFGKVGIDMIAGPSEVVVICDHSADPDWVAMDLFAQAEHDEWAQSIALTHSQKIANAIRASIEKLLPGMERQEIIRSALSGQGAIIKTRSKEESAEICNRIAPEHLELMVADPDALNHRIRHAGAIFMGKHSAESLGDYCAGPSHVLPTAGTARFSSPLGVYDYQKRSSIVFASEQGASEMAGIASVLARCEGLTAHARSAEYRSGGKVVSDLQSAVNQWVRPEISGLQAYHAPPAEGMIKLDAMESPYQLPVDLKRKWLDHLASCSINRYPDPGSRELKQHIRKVMQVPSGSDIILGNGSDELIQMVAMMLGGRGRKLAAPSPSFSMYQMISIVTSTEFVALPLDQNFAADQEQFVSIIEAEKPACIFIAYPNNPTGNSFPGELIEQLIAAAPGVVVVDEAYHSYSGKSFLCRQSEFPNLLVMRTLSKSGLAGLRLGMMMGDPAWLSQLEKIRLPYNINCLTQAGASFCLQYFDVFTDQANELIAQRGKLLTSLSGIDRLIAFPSDANFILVRLDRDLDAAKVHASMKRQGVLVKNLHQPDGSLHNCLRLTVSIEEENTLMLDALRQAVA